MESTDEPTTFLFVAGVARSGTTALTNVLASHRQIVIGIERFKFLLGQRTIRDFVPRYFEKEAFFDFSDGLTNLTPDHADHGPFVTRFYERMREKFDTATYFGDKVPNNFWFLDDLHRQFAPLRLIFIFRDVAEVALSWDQRAMNPADGWPSQNGTHRAVDTWNEAIARYTKFAELHPHTVLPLEHSKFFGDAGGSGAELERAMNFLKLDVDASVATAYGHACNRYRTGIVSKPRSLSPDLEAYIAEHADLAGMQNIFSSSS